VLWVRNTSIGFRDALREIGDKIRVCSIARKQPGADRDFIASEEARLIRQRAILCDLDDDLNQPKTAVELWAQREDIDRLVEQVG
jgi:hypothetical protein